MRRFIKLTLSGLNHSGLYELPCAVDSDTIVALTTVEVSSHAHEFTVIHCKEGIKFQVKESVDKIIELINSR